MVLRILTLILASLVASCLRYTPIKTERHNYDGSDFRTDGYYWNTREIYHQGKLIDSSTSVLIFFRNGFFSSNSFNHPDLKVIEGLLSKTDGPYTVLGGTGHYLVSDDHIHVEFWTNVARLPIPTSTVSGQILNDTTLMFEIFGRKSDDHWHFRPLSQKPDSTTVFDEQLEKGLPIKRSKKWKVAQTH